MIELIDDRIWRILSEVRQGKKPGAAIRPNIKDAYVARMIWESASSESILRMLVAGSDSIAEWARRLSDEEIAYLLWLQRDALPR